MGIQWNLSQCHLSCRRELSEGAQSFGVKALFVHNLLYCVALTDQLESTHTVSANLMLNFSIDRVVLYPSYTITQLLGQDSRNNRGIVMSADILHPFQVKSSSPCHQRLAFMW